jgi:hypothetical protein
MKWCGYSRGRVPRAKQDWNATPFYDFSDWGDTVPTDVYVQYCEIELRSLCENQSLANFAGLGHDPVAKLLHHFGGHHED